MKPDLAIAIAIYGAVVSTLVALWNWYAWRRSNRLHLVGYTSPEMEMGYLAAMNMGADPAAKYLTLCVSNRGHVPCTVNTVWLLSYSNWWGYLRHRHTTSIHVQRPASELFGCSVPYKLDRAGEFRAIALQNADLEGLSRTTRLYMAISHSMSKKPFRVRVAPIAARAPVQMKTKSKAA